jgi:hypothetical protein
MEVDGSGIPVGITRDAFRVDDDGISTNWIEFNGGDLAAACLLLASVRVARKNHRVGVMNVGAALDLGKANRKVIKAIHDPIEPPDVPNPGHALLTGVAAGDSELLDQLALLVELESFSVAAIALSKSKFGR